MDKGKIRATILAILAAVFYAVNMPMSKILLKRVEPAYMASFLYFGAGIGIGMLYLLKKGNGTDRDQNLSAPDMPYVLGMVLLDVAAPILLMIGLTTASSANASLLNNFEIVATSLIALLVFKEEISLKLWLAILLITFSSALLSLEDLSGIRFSIGSLFVLAAAVCWGFENNFTRKISAKNTFQIVMIKGIFSGLGSLIVARIGKAAFPHWMDILSVLGLGFIAYGLSIFLYVRAQNDLGAAKTSAYYAIAPFVGALLSFAILREEITANYVVALLIMVAGSALLVLDTLMTSHTHVHTHTFVDTHEGVIRRQTYTHAHKHRHFLSADEHEHLHQDQTREKE